MVEAPCVLFAFVFIFNVGASVEDTQGEELTHGILVSPDDVIDLGIEPLPRNRARFPSVAPQAAIVTWEHRRRCLAGKT